MLALQDRMRHIIRQNEYSTATNTQVLILPSDIFQTKRAKRSSYLKTPSPHTRTDTNPWRRRKASPRTLTQLPQIPGEQTHDTRHERSRALSPSKSTQSQRERRRRVYLSYFCVAGWESTDDVALQLKSQTAHVFLFFFVCPLVLEAPSQRHLTPMQS